MTWPCCTRSITIAQRTADHQRERQGVAPVGARGATEPIGQHRTDRDREPHEHVFLPTARIGEKTERRAGVIGAVPVPKAVDDRHGFVLRQCGEHPGFAPLIESDHDRRECEPEQCIGFGGLGHTNPWLGSASFSPLVVDRHSSGLKPALSSERPTNGPVIPSAARGLLFGFVIDTTSRSLAALGMTFFLDALRTIVDLRPGLRHC